MGQKGAGSLALPALMGGGAAAAGFGPAGAAAGFSIGSSISSLISGSNAEKKALKAQKKAMKQELEFAKRRAKLEERQFNEAVAQADRQLVERIGIEERQAAVQAAEDRLAIKADLDTANLDAARQAADIRKALNSTLGEQEATLAARGVLSGSLRESFDAEAREVAAGDRITNEINRLTAGADAEANLRGVETSLSNQREANAATLAQTRQASALQLQQSKEATGMALRQQEAAAKSGYMAARDQSKYAQTALLLQSFGNIAATTYDFVRTRSAIDPTAAGGGGSGASAAAVKSPRPLARSTGSRAGGSSFAGIY